MESLKFKDIKEEVPFLELLVMRGECVRKTTEAMQEVCRAFTSSPGEDFRLCVETTFTKQINS